MKKLKKEFITKDSETRLHGVSNPLVGLTGNIACGKSTVAKMLKEKGLHVIDADQLIHKIYQRDETIEKVKALAPQALNKGKINFPRLRELFFNNSDLKNDLQNYLYAQLPTAFKKELPPEGQPIVYDVPLLFENNMQDKFDLIFTVSTTAEIQLERLKERDGESSDETLKAIIRNQLPLKQKEEGSDFIFRNEGKVQELEGQVDLALEKYFI